MEKIRIALLEDHKIVREGLRSLLSTSPYLEVVLEEGDPRVFLENLPNLKIDLLVLDLSLPHISGMEVLRQVKALRNDIHVVILTMHDNPEYMIRALKDGAGAFLTKDTLADTLIEAIINVKRNGIYYPPNINLQKTNVAVSSLEPTVQLGILSTQEKKVLAFMTQGMSSRKIAGELGIGTRTVETHRLNIMKKLKASNSAETIAIALKLNLV